MGVVEEDVEDLLGGAAGDGQGCGGGVEGESNAASVLGEGAVPSAFGAFQEFADGLECGA